ncbi:MAG: hypothetical protein CMM18_05830 [Rhodospirillaceae bacterium]|nr:hypothetical protein [Rhodospirillaceae bacterium]|tara:strand:+ start:375 stop:1199 length:825 start_codon:yes stop_codon:yes gene_type:complete
MENKNINLVNGVKQIIAIASGKGGVGKSTTSVNVALALSNLGKRIGLLDADVYGPSIPKMLGLSGKPDTTKEGKKIIPKEKLGIQTMSIGFLVAEDTPMIWRGPMVMSAIKQLLYEVEWNDVDILVIDLPPGTGDTQLTLAQQVPISGSVIVSTPQDVALLDVKKGINMFKKVEIPVFGVIENMSYFLCPHCSSKTEIFSYGGAKKTANEYGIEFLGEIPLDTKIREHADKGEPLFNNKENIEYNEIYTKIANKLIDKLENQESATGPKINFID